MRFPAELKKGDTIYIVAPAKAIDMPLVKSAEEKLNSLGFKVKKGAHFEGVGNYFSGTILERLLDFQSALDDDESNAILCARGGYGCVQLIDRLNWSSFIRSPKWIIGFSDVTYFHQKLNCLNIGSIHGTMPLNFNENSKESFDTLTQACSNNPYHINFNSNTLNKEGQSTGILVGGNLSILFAGLGTKDQPDYKDCILFIEDLSEPLYHIDRMLYSYERSGSLENIKGLIVGGMTSISDTERPFGMSLEEIILDHFQYRNIPICFDFPAGHIDDNRALRLGNKVVLQVNKMGESQLSFV